MDEERTKTPPPAANPEEAQRPPDGDPQASSPSPVKMTEETPAAESAAPTHDPGATTQPVAASPEAESTAPQGADVAPAVPEAPAERVAPFAPEPTEPTPTVAVTGEATTATTPVAGAAEAALAPEPQDLGTASEAAADEYAEELVVQGPNWMLAFVCWVAGLTSLYEAWVLVGTELWRSEKFANLAFGGYASLGLGILLFSVDAMRWGKRRRTPLWMLVFLLAFVLMLAGVVCLRYAEEPGRRI